MEPLKRKEKVGSVQPLNVPRPVRVTVDGEGKPTAVQSRDRPRAVVRIRDCWRIEDRWWTETPVDRLYFELELEQSEVLIVFRDQLGEGWYSQRVADD